MQKGEVHAGWRTTAKIFITLFIICCLIILVLWISNNSNSQSLSNCWKQVNDNQKFTQENYIYKCPQGTTQQCIENGKYSLSYDGIQQTATVCNKIDGVNAQCVAKGASCFACPTGSYAGCQDSLSKWVSPIY